jgi:hypothetical protein
MHRKIPGHPNRVIQISVWNLIIDLCIVTGHFAVWAI